MAKNETDGKNPNSIERQRENALIERINKEASKDRRNLELEIVRTIAEESRKSESTGESYAAGSVKKAKIALIQTAISKAKAAVSRTATMRINAYERAVRLLPVVEEARDEIDARYNAEGLFGKLISDEAIADWLNSNGHNAPQSGPWSGKQIREVLFRAPELIITHWVLECRTRMTARQLSADFNQPIDLLSELEKHYLEKIGEAISNSHRLNGHRKRTSEELLEEARHLAIRVSEEQRRGGSLDMLARERLWKSFESDPDSADQH